MKVDTGERAYTISAFLQSLLLFFDAIYLGVSQSPARPMLRLVTGAIRAIRTFSRLTD